MGFFSMTEEEKQEQTKERESLQERLKWLHSGKCNFCYHDEHNRVICLIGASYLYTEQMECTMEECILMKILKRGKK